jgi:DNA-binding MurR/RpiR family transcriptional regulator
MALIAEGEITATEAARLLGMHRTTVTRWARAFGIDSRKARADLLSRLAVSWALRCITSA